MTGDQIALLPVLVIGAAVLVALAVWLVVNDWIESRPKRRHRRAVEASRARARIPQHHPRTTDDEEAGR